MRKCGNTWRYTSMNSIKVVTYKYTRKCTSMNRKRALTSLKRKTRETHKGAWKDGALKDLLGIHATVANSDQL